MTENPVLHRIGLIADVQYVDDDDAYNYNKTRLRYYRQSLQHMTDAIEKWRQEGVDRVIQLGDLIDGKSHNQGKRDKDFAALSKLVHSLPVPWHHCIGNHELYNFNEKELRAWMSADSGIDLGNGGDDTRNYYGFSPVSGYSIVVLNSYEISNVKPSSVDKEEYLDASFSTRKHEAQELLKKNNPNEDKNSPTGLDGLERRWCAFNGGLGRDQLAWFDQTLEDAQQKGEKVIVVSHVPLDPRACADVLDLAWDYEEAVKVMACHRDCIVAVFAGHDHDGNAFFDHEANVVYVTFKAVLETAADSSAFAICDLYSDRLELRGFGEIPSFTVKF